jgi:uncharacterized membrane protein
MTSATLDAPLPDGTPFPMSIPTTQRLGGIDTLRGLAVLLMIEQHLGVWLWHIRGSLHAITTEHPLMLGFNALGGLAAPLFITLAGVGAVFLCNRHGESRDRTLILRGTILLAMGYGLNLLTPGWFSWGSWYVLHLIGAGLLLSPLLLRLPTAALLGCSAATLLATVLIQNGLDTPLQLSNSRMRDLSLAGGPLRLALAESQFPLFPWLALYTSGIVAGRWIHAGRSRRIFALAGVCLGLGLLLAGAGTLMPALRQQPLLYRALTLAPSFYPGFPPIMLLLASAALILLALAAHPRSQSLLRPGNPLGSLGQASLSILFVHILLFREGLQRLGRFQTFSEPLTLTVIVAAGLMLLLLCPLWRRVRFRFGLEWLLRKIAG